jgi:hypothetical protein
MALTPITENSSAIYTATLLDSTGAPVSSASVDTLTLTFYDNATGDIINNRNAQDVFNTNNVTLDTSGSLVWAMLPEDNPIVGGLGVDETHVAEFYATWNGGANALSWRAIFRVIQFRMLS